MHRTVVVFCCALVMLAPRHGLAQELRSFEDLALRINLDDRLQVEDQSGVKTTGRLTRLTRDDLAIESDAGEKRFTTDTVRTVAVRGYGLRKGALIGAGVFAGLGAVAAAAHGGSAAGSLAAAPLGAAFGTAVAALIPRMKAIYRASENGASVPRSRDAIGVHASLLEDLALRVNLDDQLRVDDQSGGRTTGRLTHLTADEITLQTNAGEKHFTRDTVGRVAVRRRPLRMATLIGAGGGAVYGTVAACRSGADDGECPDGWIFGGGLGAGAGLVVGALIHRTTVVYPEPEKRTLVLPVISRRAGGVSVSVRW